MVDLVTDFRPSDHVRLDRSRVGRLYAQLGDRNAEDVLCRAIEELAVRLAHCETLWRKEEHVALRKSARSIVAIADQIGLQTLSSVAVDITRTIDMEDDVATAATLARLLRTGERSLTEVWDLRDLSV